MRVWFDRTLTRHAILAFCMALIALMLWRSEESVFRDDAPELRGPRDPDAFAINALYRAFDTEGRLAASLQTDRVDYLEAAKEADMTAPRGQIRSHGSEFPWAVSAQRGTYSLVDQSMQLIDDVVVASTDPERALTLNTARLTLDNSARIVHTDAPVRLASDAGIVEAIGLKAWLDDRVIELNSRIEGTYAPKPGR
ncbi:MAG: LPS export ABC transporter periplasmic protein LptC [Gammaproteobacteria bacterium]|nr:LPS export ABC transporter periplasmic protein LptC [Gammaproteobacteria bacterium]